MESLWGPAFTIEDNIKKTKKILDKITNPKEFQVELQRQLKSKKLSLEDRLFLITENVTRILGKYKDDTLVIKTRAELTSFIDLAIKNGEVAVDTETNNSLDPLTCKLLGPCFYTPNHKQIYVPLNHINPYTRQRLDWQLTEQDIKEELLRLVEANTKIIMHLGKFDIQVLKETTGVFLDTYWDTKLVTRLINENERSAELKYQYINKIDPAQEKYSIDHLFKNVEYKVVDPEIFALYAATDAFMTYKLYKWQKQFFKDNPDLNKVLNLILTLEMPLIKVTAAMELFGIELDLEYAKKLSRKYHLLLDETNKEIDIEMLKYKHIIDNWRQTPDANNITYKQDPSQNLKNKQKGKSKNMQLEDPINFSSPIQLAILLYDILKIKPVDRLKPRGTGENILIKITEENNIPLCNLILKMRGINKLIDTYIDKLPTLLNKKDNRIHAQFNQDGAGTGRYSSKEPNMQNIPAQNREIRLMFKAKPGYVLVGGDFSSQEPRLVAHYSNDKNMIRAYQEDKDLYSVVAQSMYGNKYEDNLEFYPLGTKLIIDNEEIVCGENTHQNKLGKERRAQAKAVLLGLLYGRGAASIGEEIGKSFREGQRIIDKFYAAFPTVYKWINATQATAKKTGFVEDFYGRRRRLPDLLLKPYIIEVDKNLNEYITIENFNPFLGVKSRPIDTSLLEKYYSKIEKIQSYKDYEQLKILAKTDGLNIRANTTKIAQAERQTINAIVQGGAATLTKLAMLNIYNDDKLQKLGFKLLVTVHDELMGECPKENAEEVVKRLSKVMVDTAKPYMEVPMKCDTYIVSHWYANELKVSLQEEYKKLLKTMSEESAFKQLCNNHIELTEENIYNALHLDYLTI